jgi:hypothetical protein
VEVVLVEETPPANMGTPSLQAEAEVLEGLYQPALVLVLI